MTTRKITGQDVSEDLEVGLTDEARVAIALYLKVYSKGKVTPEGITVPELNIHKLAQAAEVSEKMVSKTFERLRGKGFLGNMESGHLVVKSFDEFQEWLVSQGAVIPT